MLLQEIVARSSFLPLAQSDTPIAPALILILCAVAGIGTLMLLPSRREAPLRKIGGAVLAAALVILFALVIKGTEYAMGWNVYFWVFAIVAIVGAVRVVTHPRPVYSALYFVLTVFATAGLFILLSADFMAAALVLIYAGAILVTYVFVIMLASQASTPDGASSTAGMADYDITSREPFVAACGGFGLMGVLLFLIFDKANGLISPQPLIEAAGAQAIPDSAINGPTEALGVYMFQHQLINLELAGLILTLSMIGAIVIARRRILLGGGQGVEGYVPEEVLGPATPIDDNPHSIPVVGTTDPRQKAFPQT